MQNTRRYVAIFSEAVSELLPLYRQREVRRGRGREQLHPCQSYMRRGRGGGGGGTALPLPILHEEREGGGGGGDSFTTANLT